jgi:hypothetical protein
MGSWGRRLRRLPSAWRAPARTTARAHRGASTVAHGVRAGHGPSHLVYLAAANLNPVTRPWSDAVAVLNRRRTGLRHVRRCVARRDAYAGALHPLDDALHILRAHL